MLVNGTEIHKLTSKDSNIVPNNLCLGNVSKVFQQVTWKKKKMDLFDYDAIDVVHVLGIHKYLMKKNDIV